MPGLVPETRALPTQKRRKDVDGRDKPGHDAIKRYEIYYPLIRSIVAPQAESFSSSFSKPRSR
jgi:hypothetical protein